MTEYPPTAATPHRAESKARARLTASHPGGISLEEVTGLVERASGADAAAIDGLEEIAAALRRARDARTELAARVPPELLRQVLIARANTSPLGQPDKAQQSGGTELLAVVPDGRSL